MKRHPQRQAAQTIAWVRACPEAALLTVRRPLEQVRGWVTGLMLVALATGGLSFQTPSRHRNGRQT